MALLSGEIFPAREYNDKRVRKESPERHQPKVEIRSKKERSRERKGRRAMTKMETNQEE